MATIEQIKTVLVTTAPRWQHLAAAVPEALLARKPKAGEWSALECLRHLTEGEQFLWPVRIKAFLAGTSFPDFDPNAPQRDYSTLSPTQLADEFARLREANLPLLESVTEDDLDRPGTHPRLGAVKLGQMLHVWAAHDLMHTVQGERALMQPFIMEAGPWRGFAFTDHDVSPATDESAG